MKGSVGCFKRKQPQAQKISSTYKEQTLEALVDSRGKVAARAIMSINKSHSNYIRLKLNQL